MSSQPTKSLPTFPGFMENVLSCFSLKELARSGVFATCKKFNSAAENTYKFILRNTRQFDFFQECRHFSQHKLHRPTTRREILDLTSSITHLTFDDYWSSDEMNWDTATWERLETILSSPNARRLTYLRVSIQTPPNYVTDESVAAIASRCPHLTDLSIHWARGMTGAGTAHLVKLQGLKKVSFFKSSAVDDATTQMLAQLPTLTELCLYGCNKITHRGITTLLQNSPNLRTLDAGGEIGEDGGADQQAQIALAIAEHGQKLESLDLSHSSYRDADLLQIAEKCHKLVSINLHCSSQGSRTNPSQLAAQIQDKNPTLKVKGLDPSPEKKK